MTRKAVPQKQIELLPSKYPEVYKILIDGGKNNCTEVVPYFIRSAISRWQW